MGEIDRRERLTAEPFSFRVTKEQRVRIAHEGREVVVLGEKESIRFLQAAEGTDAAAQQLLMARITGNFKRGNERHAKRTRRNEGG